MEPPALQQQFGKIRGVGKIGTGYPVTVALTLGVIGSLQCIAPMAAARVTKPRLYRRTTLLVPRVIEGHSSASF
jgi:hypothetical protein